MLMIDAGTKNGEMRRAPRARVLDLRLLDHRQPADARADQHTDALGLLFGQRVAGGQPGILHRLDGGGHAVMDEGVHVAGFLAGDVVLDIEALDLTGKPAGQPRGIETGDVVDAALGRPGCWPSLRPRCCPPG
jgi:hypothetical protein